MANNKNNNILQQARQTMQNLTNRNQNKQQDEETADRAVQHGIQAAYEQGSPEEQEQVRQLEQRMNQQKMK
ncbi:DUF3813 family protein [Tenuibacillus multivorans]|uniref:Uncharacterized protein n=1 Tax=Tenuibacillus multivorans TaxID=237069 RepID=A0A1G9ZZS4_9BACI|nr:DUF3813 family protein [Tenuibacillus multivorans]GEL76902.1 hypothetical protein TMU01_11370 [Tenuibacillus multivorans]SDN26411.1 Protein of unknown function [Tenuibacillus multivorans]